MRHAETVSIAFRIEFRVLVGARRAVPSRLDLHLSAELSAKDCNSELDHRENIR